MIASIDFQAEDNPERYKEVLKAWYSGGIVGRCPGCGQYVLFTPTEKRQVLDDPVSAGMTKLPEDWDQRGYIEN